MPPLILASNSPRRKELLSLTGFPFVVLSADVDESLFPGEEPIACVMRLARLKAETAQQMADGLGFTTGQVIVAADTIVVNDGAIFGKPSDQLDARRMLVELRGHNHQVLTAISISTAHGQKHSTVVCETDVPMRNYTDEEMDEYIRSGDPLDKAGAYAIQHEGFQPVKKMTGCFASVMGLPLCHLVKELESYQLSVLDDVPTACQTNLDYECPIYATILTRYQFKQEKK